MPTLAELQAFDREQGAMQLRTLYAQNLQTLVRLPRLAAELKAMIASTEALDYTALAQQMQSALNQANDFLLAVDLAPIEYPDQPELARLGQSLFPLVNSSSVVALSAKFQQSRDAAVKVAKVAQAEQAQEAAAAQKIAQRRKAAKALGYVDNGDGTVTDTRTGLMWKQCVEGQSGAACEGRAGEFNWDTAMKIPQTLNQRGGFAGYHDWRVPTKDELESLVMHGRTNPAICTEAFPNTPASFVWSGSPSANDASFAWGVYFDDGYSYDYYRSSYYGVRLVRGGQ
jgi:hypothetical protein